MFVDENLWACSQVNDNEFSAWRASGKNVLVPADAEVSNKVYNELRVDDVCRAPLRFIGRPYSQHVAVSIM